MTAISDYAEKAMLDWVLGGATPTRPTTRYVSLHTTATTDAGGGTEVVGNGYSRQTVTFNAASTPGGTADNAGGVSFTASGGNWGTITHMAIWDASTSGNMLWHGALTTQRIVNDGDTLTFAAGAIVCTLG
jgi:uncharacterized protein RhaS with RHS repeats